MKCHAHSLLFAVAAVALLSGCQTQEHKAGGAAAAGAASDAATLFADYHEERLRLYPMEATYAGDDRYNDQLPNNITEEFRAREKAFFQKYLEAVGHLDPKRISAEDQLSRDILQWECETQLERLRFPMHLMPINQFQSLHLEIGQWAGSLGENCFQFLGSDDGFWPMSFRFLHVLDGVSLKTTVLHCPIEATHQSGDRTGSPPDVEQFRDSAQTFCGTEPLNEECRMMSEE